MHFQNLVRIPAVSIVSLLFGAQVLAAGVFPGPQPAVDPAAPWLGVMGDSGSTGAVSDKNMNFNLATVMNILVEYAKDSSAHNVQPAIDGHPLQKLTPALPPPVRVYYTDAEEKAGDAAKLSDGMKAALRVDLEENSFGYQFGIQKGFKPEQMVLVGQDGTRVDSIPTQIARFFQKPATTLPQIVLVSFNANDFCDAEIFKDDIGKRTEMFRKDLTEAWEKAAPMLKPHPLGTRFIVLSPIEVANILTNPSVLEQKIDFESKGGLTCGELRSANFAAEAKEANGGDIFKKLGNIEKIARLEAQAKVQEAMIGMCPAVLGTKPGDQDRLHFLQQIQSQFRQVWRDEIGALNAKHQGQGVSWSFVESIADIAFTKGDVANDCFHPSANGAEKISAELLKLQ